MDRDSRDYRQGRFYTWVLILTLLAVVAILAFYYVTLPDRPSVEQMGATP